MPKFISNTIQAHIAAFFGNDLKYLILKRAAHLKLYPNIWQVVTGTIETGETALQCAEREIFEETGLIGEEMWTIPYITHFYEPSKDVVHASPVFGILVSSESIVKISDEHQQFQWLSLDEAKNILVLPTHIEGMRVFNDFILIPRQMEKSENYLVHKSFRSKFNH